MILFVDLDNTICTTVDGDYEQSFVDPLVNQPVINKVNRIYDNGHTVIIWTARGTTTGISWLELTSEQLQSWGVRYTELRIGKPEYTLFIDDKALTPEDWLKTGDDFRSL